MKVSVSITAYNHEKYIAQALESVLMQKTNFAYEIIVGEDDSGDCTREIAQEYQHRYPEKIRLFLNDRKNVIYINGKPSGRWNFVNNLKHAQGEYIALLDGDDYWTDSYKLQKQVDFLDSHPECVLCCHDAIVLYEDKSQESHRMNSINQDTIFTIEDMLRGNPIPTASVVFRNGLITKYPDWYYTLKPADWPLFIMLAQYGTIKYYQEAMSVYRVHGKGVWSTLTHNQSLQEVLKMYSVINPYLNFRYQRIIRSKMAGMYYRLSRRYNSIEGDSATAKKYATQFFKTCPFDKLLFDGRLVKLILSLYFPACFSKLTLRRKKSHHNGSLSEPRLK